MKLYKNILQFCKMALERLPKSSATRAAEAERLSVVVHDLRVATAALKIVAVASRPLSILELSWAATLGVAGPEVTTVSALAQLVDHQRLLSLIRPFLFEIDPSNLKMRQVLLAHESFRKFIVDHSSIEQQTKTHSAPKKRLTTREPAESLQSYMLDICVRYLLLDEIDELDLFSEKQVALQHLPLTSSHDDEGSTDYDVNCTWEVWEKDMVRYDPAERGFGEFFVYASSYWVHHYGKVTSGPRLPDLACIESLCKASSTRLHNWIEQNRRPDCAINPRQDFDSSLYDPLSITALYGSEAMLCRVLRDADLGSEAYVSQPVKAATIQLLRWGDLSRLKTLLMEIRAKDQIPIIDFFQIVIKQWNTYKIQRDSWDLAFDILGSVLHWLIRDQLGNELLCIAARGGCMPLVQRLLSMAVGHQALRYELQRNPPRQRQIESLATTRPVHQSIGEAVSGNHVDIVQSLLETGIVRQHLSHVNARGENVLHLAADVLNPAMFRLLIPRLPGGVHQKDRQGDTPLARVIRSPSVAHDRFVCARILILEGGAGRGEGGQQALLDLIEGLDDQLMCDVVVSASGMDELSILW